VFGTASHPDGAHLGAMRAKAIARVAPLAVYTLGGLNAQTAARLTGSRFVGLAAIGGLAA
jgi:thiamine monophosphate synthase